MPRGAARLPDAREEDCRIGRIHLDVGRAGVVVFFQHLAPGLAAVAGAIHAALGVRSERVAQHRGERDIGVGRMDDHLTDLPLLLPHVRPRLAAVRRLVDAVAGGDVAADVGLAGTDVDDVRIGGRNGDRAGRGDRLVVEDRLPGRTAVHGFPDAAARGRGVVDRRIARDARDARHAPARGGANQPVLERLEFLRRGALGRVVGGRLPVRRGFLRHEGRAKHDAERDRAPRRTDAGH